MMEADKIVNGAVLANGKGKGVSTKVGQVVKKELALDTPEKKMTGQKAPFSNVAFCIEMRWFPLGVYPPSMHSGPSCHAHCACLIHTAALLAGL
jgi:hypothetical protein